ncbi:hypothetical protein CRUP_029261 [Coryphaenoides rupestris]|nr:hypothetical protein CRUP_029261 [Coryphaenoides rupestris]
MTCEGLSKIFGPIPPDLSLFPGYYKRPASARGRLEGHCNGTSPLLAGPLAPDPVLHPECYSCRDPPRRPQVGPNATHILERGQRGVVGALLKLEGVSVSPSTPKQIYARLWKRERKATQGDPEALARNRRLSPVPVKALWSSSKYHNIPSRVMAQLQSLTNLKDKPIPSAVKGQVPQYLEERKEQWRKEKEERRKNAPDPTIPAGHTMMSEKDRRDTLQSLKQSHQALVKELLSLPVRADTLSMCSRRTQLDRRLSEMEEAIKIFSRDKVYIKTDS